jgi:prolyl-tRNA synthetase
MRASVTGPDGAEHIVAMGSYGIGVSRLVAGIIEASHDDSGIIWPDTVAPFTVGLINLKPGDSAADIAAGTLYERLTKAGISVLLDDVEASAGAKFAKMDLIGLPWQLIVGPKGLQKGEVEIKRRATGAREALTPDAALSRLLAA